MATYDIVLVGGGIVGLSTAWQLKREYPDKRIVLFEKEQELARHQTGHNSGVIHAGIYYEPGSLKARFCREGVSETVAFCREHGIPFEQCGKLLVATSESEESRMMALFDRAAENGLDVELLDARELSRLEPQVSGRGAIRLRTTGIVDYRQVADRMAECFRELGGEIRLGTEVVGSRETSGEVELQTGGGELFQARFIVACCGLQSDRFADMMGIDAAFRVIPFRGEYYRLADRLQGMIKHLIYPVPDSRLPFLGIHLTRLVGGGIIVGPNAVQGWKREGYGRLNFDLRDSWAVVSWPGFWRLSGAHWRTGLAEMRDSLLKRAYLRRVRAYCPCIALDDLEPYPTGIRAQAVLKDGTMVHDFLFAESPRSLHVCNAPSPAATSAIPIGHHLVRMIRERATGLF
jgi:L-2-hydroxyglutarate oxidase